MLRQARTYIIRKVIENLSRRKSQRAIKKLDAETKEDLKEFRGSNYTKIKFDTVLTDYQYNIALKLIEHVRSFTVTQDILQTYWEKYKIPVPIKPSGYNELLRAINDHSFYCIQDDRKKRHIDYFNHKHYTPSLILNESIRSVDMAIARYQAASTIDGDLIEQVSQTLSQSLIIINNSISQFYLNNSFELGQDLTFEKFKTCYPNRNFFNDAKLLHGDISSIVQLHRYKPNDVPPLILEAINAHLYYEKNLCAFSALCGLMLDAAAGTDEYFEPLRCIENHIRLIFHDAELYRLELPMSAVDTTMAIGSRGTQAHTTIMKLYLIDEHDKRVVIRIDLPHVRSPKFHFNVISPDDKRYIKFNHAEIDATNHDDSLIHVLDILKTSLKEQMSHLHVVDDTNEKEERDILADMEKFITYHHMCLNYFLNKDYSQQQKKLAGYLRIPNDNIDNRIIEAKKHYRM